jgi:hypothetical protein
MTILPLSGESSLIARLVREWRVRIANALLVAILLVSTRAASHYDPYI